MSKDANCHLSGGASPYCSDDACSPFETGFNMNRHAWDGSKGVLGPDEEMKIYPWIYGGSVPRAARRGR